MSLIIPEKKLFDIIQYILNTIRLDFESNVNEKDTLLYQMFQETKFKELDIDYYKEAKEIFLRSKDHPRKVEVRQFFDVDRASIPTIHINLPSDSPIFDALGVDAGYIPGITFGKETEISQVHTRRFNAVYQIIITSENVNEVILIYHTIRAFLISILDILDVNGLQNPKLGGGDIQFNADIVPPRVFMRAITINCFYEVSIPSLVREKIINSLLFYGSALFKP